MSVDEKHVSDLGDEESESIPESYEMYNIEEVGTDWYKQNGKYMRNMYISRLPNDVSISQLTALTYEGAIDLFHVDYKPSKNNTDQTSSMSTETSIIVTLLEKSKIFRKARKKILSSLADDTTEQINEKTFDIQVFFRIVARSKNELENLTEYITEKADQEGIGVAPINEPPEVSIRAVYPLNSCPEGVGDKYCITVRSVAFSIVNTFFITQQVEKNLIET